MPEAIGRLLQAPGWPRGRLVFAACLLVVSCWGGYAYGRRSWAQRHYEAAQEALQHEDLELAQHHLDQCLQVWSDKLAVQLLAAQIARRRDAYDEADQHLTECEHLEGKTEATSLERMLLIAQQGDPDSMLGSLNTVMAERPSMAVPILAALAKGYLNSFNKTDALAYFNLLVKRAPDHAQGFLGRGRTLESLDRPEEAVPDYRRAVELAPAADEARLRLADILYRVGRPWEALPHYECLQNRRPDNPEVLLGLARCYYDLHDLDQSRQLLDQILSGHPDSVPALLDRGQLEFHAGQMAEAKTWLGRAAKLAPWNHEVYRALSLCLQTEGTEVEKRACRERLQQIEQAIKQVDVLIEKAKHSPPDAPLRYQIADRMAGMGRQEDAVSWYFSALGDDPRYQPAHTALAEYFQQTGQLFRAARQRQLARDQKAK